jgi:hypothetical protein
LAGHLSGYALSLVYIPIDVNRNYALKGSFLASEVDFATVRFGVSCYDTNQVFLGNSLAMLDVAPGTSWVNYDFVLGPDGMDIFQPDTRYARVYIYLQSGLFAGANARMWADNIFFGPYDIKEGHIQFTVDGLGSEISSGLKGFVRIPVRCHLHGWQIVADQIGNCVFDVWKDTWANFPPTIADTITGGQKPTLILQQNNQLLAIPDWNTWLDADDWVAFYVVSAAAVTRVTVTVLLRA